MKDVNVFVDMDGVLAVYDENVENVMFDKGFFLNRPVVTSMIEVVRNLLANKDYNVFILTSVIDSPYCVNEKALWLDKNLPELEKENRIYVPYGIVKSKFAQENADTSNSINVLIDDYTENLDKWTLEGALPIKVLNGINNTNGTWLNNGGKYIDAYSNVADNVKKIDQLISDKLNEGV